MITCKHNLASAKVVNNVLINTIFRPISHHLLYDIVHPWKGHYTNWQSGQVSIWCLKATNRWPKTGIFSCVPWHPGTTAHHYMPFAPQVSDVYDEEPVIDTEMTANMPLHFNWELSRTLKCFRKHSQHQTFPVASSSIHSTFHERATKHIAIFRQQHSSILSECKPCNTSFKRQQLVRQ